MSIISNLNSTTFNVRCNHMENTQTSGQNHNDSLQDKTKSIVKDFFLNTATFVSLYWLSISFIVLVFQIINTIFPDNVFTDTNSISTFSLSSVIILTPVFFYLAFQTNKEILKDLSKKDMWIRRWLTYITLFFAGIAIIADGIALINFFLNGDITTRFILKVLTILVIPGFIFWYLRYSLNRDYSKGAYNKPLAAAVILIILSTIIGSFYVVGTPSQKRAQRIDQERIQDLGQIQYEIISYWQAKEALPENLDVLSDPLRGFITPTDPETGSPYEYNVLSAQTFELCATFTSEQKSMEANSRVSYLYDGYTNETWNHDVGRVCFERTIDPDKYAPTKPIY